LSDARRSVFRYVALKASVLACIKKANIKCRSICFSNDIARRYAERGNNQALTEEILKGYKRVLAEVAPDGTIVYKELDAMANIIGVFIP